ncbi:prepilin-type N-terminal cleavage/methylation domain-containing protein [Metallumcola ferriviriculae]|uniref:Prepilin-type N-terminal cleavage/methylation domain-containing protein n=1 Tax=Metallumcola ferriviriculae TaxID=3039180 RepID=A0AAU0UTE1_9FIRM|nr:prepilin-type N-terminal cleavage/methylation domain-containing protein [Desulfitibacteraceae bacterium MK1]
MIWREERGLTLVEVLVAMFILVAVVLGMLSVYQSGFVLTQKAGDRTQALNIAQQLIEEIKADSGSLTAGVVSDQTISGYTYHVEITNISNVNFPDLYQVKVTVEYPMVNNAKNLSLATYIKKR